MIFESVFLVFTAAFAVFGLVCFLKLWIFTPEDNSFLAIFLENEDDAEILDMKLSEIARHYSLRKIIILIPESRRTDLRINYYINQKGFKAVYYKE